MITTTLLPSELREFIKSRSSSYLSWLRSLPSIYVPEDEQMLHPKWNFVFRSKYRYLNFHPDIKGPVEDLLNGRVERRYEDAASEISINDYVGHIASSQALCWNLVLPMKKYDNFAPLFEVLKNALREKGMDSEYDFGIETSVVPEFNVAHDLGESRAATSIDLYIRTGQGKVCAIEFKFTEDDFGQCRQTRFGNCDGHYGSPRYIVKNNGYLCYLASIGRRYWHLGGHYQLLDPTRIDGYQNSDTHQCPLGVFYQPLRNLMAAKKRSGEAPGKEVRGIFVLAADERNCAFWGPGNRFDSFKEYLREVRGREVPDVYRISLQDIVSQLSGGLEVYKQYFTVKYGFPHD